MFNKFVIHKYLSFKFYWRTQLQNNFTKYDPWCVIKWFYRENDNLAV